MKVQELSVRSFRNLESVSLKPAGTLNWVFGPNGQGKTNLLEAIYATLRGKSFRPYSTRTDWTPLQRAKASPVVTNTSVHLRITDERGYQLDCGLRNSSQKWESFLGDKRVPVSRIRSLVPVVAFSPDDHALVRWEPEIRRHFLDEMLTDVCPGYAESLDRQQSALKSRNRLLKTLDRASAQAKKELEAWTETLAKCAVELLQFRLEMWGSFDLHFGEIARNLFEGGVANLNLKYEPDFVGALSFENMLNHIQADLQKDIDTGWTHRGPHRDDFSVELDGIDARSGASQGQSRMIALALKWTHAHWVRTERGEIPIFLVDDFSSEFDAQRRRKLLEFLTATKGQVFVSGTDMSLVDSESFSDYNFYSVQGGSIKQDTGGQVGELNV